MGYLAEPGSIAHQARRGFLAGLLSELPAALQAVEERVLVLSSQEAPPGLRVQRHELAGELRSRRPAWEAGLLARLGGLQEKLDRAEPRPAGSSSGLGELSLVDDETIEKEILSSRLALAIVDQASFEFNELRSRMNHLDQREEMSSSDCLRPHVLARALLDAWREAGLSLERWRVAQPVLHPVLSQLLLRNYRQTNCWLSERGVLPAMEVRPLIRRAQEEATGTDVPRARFYPDERGGAGRPAAPASPPPQAERAGRYDDTRLMTREPASGSIPGLLERLQERLPGAGLAQAQRQPSAALAKAMADVEQQVARQWPASSAAPADANAMATLLLDGVHEARHALKSATESPIERATIEIVALLFQSILTEERLPATVRVWFARLQMPVLRVAIVEPSFFAAPDHPARRLIDRMGACVMGFDGGTSGAMGPAVEAEIKRVVQVVEAYPDTGRRVFQTVLLEFEKFLEDYFRNENELSRVGISLAQQIELRETLSIQYMIELRKMLDEVPVQEGIREFLFHVWADVLAMTAVKTGKQSEQTRLMKRAAADLIWSASAKVTREERAEVIRRLPPLLKALREGMSSAGLQPERQDAQIRLLNNSLAAAFTAKTAVIPKERLEALMQRLEALEELLPGDADIEIDEALVLNLSSHESAELDVVGEGGGMPSPEMLACARELHVGQWFKLDYRGRNQPVQLAWQGLRKHLSLFASASGHCVLFQQHRLAAFLQAGLLVPAEGEALTVRATRAALAKLDADPSRLLS